jgi:hypothetical protein
VTFAVKKLRPRSRATHPAVVDADVARLLLLSLPPGYRMHPKNGKR